MKEIDKDGDGNIDFEEFKSHMLGLLEKGEYNQRPELKKLESDMNIQAKAIANTGVTEENSDIDSDDFENPQGS